MSNLQVNTYKVLARCVEEGVSYGWNRAHKHVDDPDPAAIQDAIQDAVMNAICEYFEFPESGET